MGVGGQGRVEGWRSQLRVEGGGQERVEGWVRGSGEGRRVGVSGEGRRVGGGVRGG